MHFRTTNLESYKTFLINFEKDANSEIQAYLKDNFINAMDAIKNLTKYKIEDIEVNIESLKSNTLENNKYIEQLKINKSKESMKNINTIKRLQNSFNSTPILNTDIFYASKFDVRRTIAKSLNKNSNSKFQIIILTAIISAIFAIFYFIILNKQELSS